MFSILPVDAFGPGASPCGITVRSPKRCLAGTNCLATVKLGKNDHREGENTSCQVFHIRDNLLGPLRVGIVSYSLRAITVTTR